MGLFSNLIGSRKTKTAFIYAGGTSSRSKPWNVNIEQHDICVSILDCNAAHTAKAQVLHVKMDKKGRVSDILRNSDKSKLFLRPNPYMSEYDLLYAMSWQLDLKNTAIAWVNWDDAHAHPLEIWPIAYQQYEICAIDGGGFAVHFFDMDGQPHFLFLDDTVILRRHFDASGPSGGINTPVNSAIEVVESVDSGIKDAVDISNKVHGVLKNTKSMLSTDFVKQNQTDFISRMKEAAANGGIVSLDATEEYVPLNISAWAANAAQMKIASDRLYGYWRTPQEVVIGTASEQTMENYYDGIIEPRWQALGQALTSALFTVHEQDVGNRIMVFGNSADSMSWQTKISIITAAKETALLTVNEQRGLMGYPPVADGDVRQVSLNYVQSQDQSKYQTGSDPDGGNEDASKNE